MFKKLKIKEPIYYCLLILITVGVCFPFLYMKSISTTDEFVSIAIPYQLSGADWGDIISSRNWHGYGVTIFLVPFLKYFSSNMIMPMFLMLGVIVRTLCVLITYFIANKLCKVNSFNSFIICLISSYGFLGNCTYGETNILQELPMVLICLLVIPLLFNNELKWYKTAIAAVFSSYLVLIHSRYLVVYFGIVVVLLVKCYLEKKGYLNILLFLVILGALYFGFNYLNTEITKMCFSSSTKTVSNTVSSITKTKSIIAYTERIIRNGIWGTFKMVMGLLASFTFWSLGLIWFTIFACIKSIKNSLKNKEKFSTEQYIGLFGIVMFFTMVILLTIMAMDGKGEKLYRNYMLVRYAMPFTWMIILAGTVILSRDFKNFKKEIIISGIVSLVLEIWFIDVLAKWFDLESYSLKSSPFRYFLFANGVEWDSCVHYFSFLLKITVILYILLFILGTRNKLVAISLIYLILSAAYIKGNYDYFIFRTNSILYPKVSESKEFVKSVLEESSDREYNIYYSGTDFYCMLLRMEFPYEDMNYIEDMDEIDFSHDYILLTDNVYISSNEELYKLDYDDEEYLLTNMSDIIESRVFYDY